MEEYLKKKQQEEKKRKQGKRKGMIEKKKTKEKKREKEKGKHKKDPKYLGEFTFKVSFQNFWKDLSQLTNSLFFILSSKKSRNGFFHSANPSWPRLVKIRSVEKKNEDKKEETRKEKVSETKKMKKKRKWKWKKERKGVKEELPILKWRRKGTKKWKKKKTNEKNTNSQVVMGRIIQIFRSYSPNCIIFIFCNFTCFMI